MNSVKIFLLIFLTIPLALAAPVDLIQNGLHAKTGTSLVISTIFTLISLWLLISIKKRRVRERDKQDRDRQIQRNIEENKRIYSNQINTINQLTILPFVESPSSILLKSQEICHFQTSASTLVVKSEVVGRAGAYNGASIHVAKGLTLHSGGSRGKPIRKEVPYTYPGLFSITNQRIIMTGEKGFDFPIGKLTSITPYNWGENPEGVIMQFGRSSYTILMYFPQWVPKILELMRTEEITEEDIFDEDEEDLTSNREQNLAPVQSEGMIQEKDGNHILSKTEKCLRKDFPVKERNRKDTMRTKVLCITFQDDIFASINFREKYEKENIMASKTGTPKKTFEAFWEEQFSRYLRQSIFLNFDDCNNSATFQMNLRRFYAGCMIAGSSQIPLPLDFEERMGEYLDCPGLDKQLSQKCVFPNPPKLRIYYENKVRLLNLTQTGYLKEWDGNFFLGMYDCTDPFHFSMAEFEYYSTLDIPNFPKTHKTYYKHKQLNSEKYQLWMEAIGDRRLKMPTIES